MPTRVQIVQIVILGVAIFVAINILFVLLVFGASVLTGMWTDRPAN